MPSLAKKRCPQRPQVLFLLGALLGAAAFLAVYGFAPLDVTNDAFCRGGYLEKDIQQHYAGWLFYRQSDLSFPLCIAQGVNAPNGISVAYTDSIPLFAAFFRLLSPVLPATFQYFGLFTFLCFLLQGAFGALLLGLFSGGLALPLLGDVLFVTSPILFERALRHTSLGAQFFLLGALYLYFKNRRANRYASPGLFVLNILAITIHPYFLPMTYAITLAMLVEYAFSARRFAGPALYLGADLALTVLTGWAFGLFYGTASGGSDALYGYFGLNLNALWNPVGVGGTVWSRLLPAQNQVGGNYDAFAYLGLGVLAALVGGALVQLLRRRLALRGSLARHWMLCLVCLVLTAFAVSHVVTANGATLFTLPLPGSLIRLFSVFRSCGRLFWPVYELLVLSAFILLLRALVGTRWGVAAVALMAAIQLWDLSPGLLQRQDALQAAQTTQAFPSLLQSAFWGQAAQRYRQIASMDGIQHDSLHLALYAADNGMLTNDPFAARYDSGALQQQRGALLAELSAGTLRNDTLYLFADEGAFLQAVEPVRDSGAWCGRLDAPDGSGCWYVIAPGLAGSVTGADCVPYDENYPLRLADYTDALWNRGVLDSDRQTVCFADAPFTRAKLQNATALCVAGSCYAITNFDDHDPGWLMVTLDIPDATVLWGKELETINR